MNKITKITKLGVLADTLAQFENEIKSYLLEDEVVSYDTLVEFVEHEIELLENRAEKAKTNPKKPSKSTKTDETKEYEKKALSVLTKTPKTGLQIAQEVGYPIEDEKAKKTVYVRVAAWLKPAIEEGLVIKTDVIDDVNFKPAKSFKGYALRG